jgi:hypothetical protein
MGSSVEKDIDGRDDGSSGEGSDDESDVHDSDNEADDEASAPPAKRRRLGTDASVNSDLRDFLTKEKAWSSSDGIDLRTTERKRKRIVAAR